MNNISYPSSFFSKHESRSISSAAKIIPFVLQYIQPESVIDIGCGNGTWLKVWKEKGVDEILGIDGDYIKPEQLLISQSSFRAFNLEEGYRSDKKYDLVTSLEVAEHIKAQYASAFIDSLCQLGDVVLFSAAIPGQPGTFHFNEQYPEYWKKKFMSQGFVAIDCLREKIWNNTEIEWWYRQNILFFVNSSCLNNYEALKNEFKGTGEHIRSLVHPDLLEEKIRLAAHYKKLLSNPIKAFSLFVKKLF